MKRKFFFWEEYWRLREIKNCNLYQIMKEQRRPFSEDEIRSFMSQLLLGLNHLHRSEYFHRDLKPGFMLRNQQQDNFPPEENLLVTNDVLKISDFGLAREVSSMPPYTEYVSTRWYRAPEVLLQSKLYTPAVDMWAAGAILAELFTWSPIFPEESERDQLFKICCMLGTPDFSIFP